MASPSNTILQVVGKLLQAKTLETENAKNRAFALQQLDAKNRQALSLIGAQETSAIAINKAKIGAQTRAQIELLKDPTTKQSLKDATQEKINANMHTHAMTTFGTTAVLKYDKDRNVVGILSAGVPRHSLHDGEVIRAITTTHDEKIPGSDEPRVSPAYFDDIAKRNPYYANPNVEHEDFEQVYTKVLTRLQKGEATGRDINFIPGATVKLYKSKGFDKWDNPTRRRLLKENIKDAVTRGDINTGYDESFAKPKEFITTEPQYRKVRKEISPETFFSNNKGKGIYLTGSGQLWINGEFQGVGANMNDLVRNPALDGSIEINISPDKKSATYVSLAQNVAKTQSGLSGRNAALKSLREMDVTLQASAEKLSPRWFKPGVFQMTEKGGLIGFGWDENEGLEELGQRLDGVKADGTKIYDGITIQDQVDHAKNLWNNPKAGEMHEYRQKVVEQLGYLIRQINQDVDKTDKYKFYDKDDWQAHAKSDPKGTYQGGLEDVANPWSYTFGTQNKDGISTYDEYLNYMSRLVSLREQLMLEEKENYNLSSPFGGYY